MEAMEEAFFASALAPRAAATILPVILLAEVSRFLKIDAFAAFRRCATSWNEALEERLQHEERLRAAWQEHLSGVAVMGSNARRVWVGIRVRPLQDTGCVEVLKRRITVEGHPPFFFNEVFDQNCTQSQVWHSIQPMLLRAMLRRESACLLAYGQTGSGKTHTMFGQPEVPGQEGVAFRAIRAVKKFLCHDVHRLLDGELDPSSARSGSDADVAPDVDFSFLEVYNEKVRDLLGQHRVCPLALKNGCVVPEGLTRIPCDLEELDSQVATLINEGAASRIVGRTVFNPQSSRSHAVATLHIHWSGRMRAGGAGSHKTTHLYLVDLAGSERAGQYALSEKQLKEGSAINQSLSVLGRVVGALARGQKQHVPTRDSALTWLLSDAITGKKARAFMVATLQPAHVAETVSTLRYAHEYSCLGSDDIAARIHRETEQIREAKFHTLPRLRRELDVALFQVNFQGRVAAKWDLRSLTKRAVKLRREAQEMCEAHPYLSWTEAHQDKAAVGTVGVVDQVFPRGAPLPTAPRESPPDGRRRLVLGSVRPQAQTADYYSIAKVIFPGKNGRADTVLFCPEPGLVTVEPPRNLGRQAYTLQRAEERLRHQEASLKELEGQLKAQHERWMEG